MLKDLLIRLALWIRITANIAPLRKDCVLARTDTAEDIKRRAAVARVAISARACSARTVVVNVAAETLSPVVDRNERCL